MITDQTEEFIEDYLAHHGVLGMKWGIHKEESTGSGSSSTIKTISARKLSRATSHEFAARKAQSEINRFKSSSSTSKLSQYHQNHQIKNLTQTRDRHTKAALDIRSGHMTDKQKKIFIGAGAVAVAATAYGTYKFVDSGHAQGILSKGTPFKKNDLLSRHMSPDGILKEVVKPINSGYGELGTKMNCRRCTFAYELRRRGFDVRSTKSLSGTGQNIGGLLRAVHPKSDIPSTKLGQFSRYIKESSGKESLLLKPALEKGHGLGKIGIDHLSEVPLTQRSNTIFRALSRHPEGARGELTVKWAFGGSHSMAWEIIKGRPHIFDAQSGHVYRSANEFLKTSSVISEAGLTRLDNANLNMNFLKRWIVNG